MKKALALLALLLATPVSANEGKITKGYYSYDAMGCMLVQECTEGIKRLYSIVDLQNHYKRPFLNVDKEFDAMMRALNEVGVKVFLADQKYFPVGHRGVYHTVGNNFFLNEAYMHRESTLMSVMRHEGWHAAQDCMAGSIKNSMIAIIHNEEDVPMLWKEMVERTYPPASRPWEAEATWAGKTAGMTQKALESCAAGTMWSDYKPTPLTEKWLREEGFIK